MCVCVFSCCCFVFVLGGGGGFFFLGGGVVGGGGFCFVLFVVGQIKNIPLMVKVTSTGMIEVQFSRA